MSPQTPPVILPRHRASSPRHLNGLHPSLSASMLAKSIELSRIGGPSKLAVALDVPISALDVVGLSSGQCCKTARYSLSAALHNLGECILHSETWFPREFERFGKPAAKRRGYGLYGPHFLRNYTGKNVAIATAACFGFPTNRIRLLRLRGFWGFPPRIENGLLLIQQRRQPADACGGR